VAIIQALEAYCDESADSHHQRICIVAGLLGSTRAWRSAEREWERITRGKPLFHAKDFFARVRGRRVGVYKDWSDADAHKYITLLANVVALNDFRLLSVSVDVQAFNALDLGARRFLTTATITGFDNPAPPVWRSTGAPSRPYFLAMSECIALALKANSKPEWKVHFWFDRLKENEGYALELFRGVQQSAPERLRKMAGGIVYQDKALYPGLQMADLVAYMRCAIEQDNWNRPRQGPRFRVAVADIKTAHDAIRKISASRIHAIEIKKEYMDWRLGNVPLEIRSQWNKAKLKGRKTGKRRRSSSGAD